jgi:hypothetical protein
MGAVLTDNDNKNPTDLFNANLTGADLTGATITQAQLNNACGTNVRGVNPPLTFSSRECDVATRATVEDEEGAVLEVNPHYVTDKLCEDEAAALIRLLHQEIEGDR